MTNKIILQFCKNLVFILFLVSLVSCHKSETEIEINTEVENKQKELSFILQSAFGSIYFARHGLDFPHNDEELARCVKHNITACLTTYGGAMDAKNTIKSLPDKNKLDTTLDIIERTCVSKNKDIANVICHGAIMSLYFYPTAGQDNKILTRIKKFPPKVNSTIFNTDFYWFRNRPNNKLWFNYITEADIELTGTTTKDFIKDRFKLEMIEIDGNKPWVLRE